MKKYFLLALVVLTGIASSCKYDDDEVWDSVNNLADRVANLEAMTKQMNSDIAAMQSIVTALQNKLTVTEVEELADGYILHFSDGTQATIKNGADGKDGANGEDGKDGADGENGKDGKDGKDAPVVGVAQEDGVYYWTMTIDGKTEWLTDEDGNKMRVSGKDGEDGKDGSSGSSGSTGAAGQNGKTPVVTINSSGNWAIDGKDTGVKAKGEKGQDGDSQFETPVKGDGFVTIPLTNGTSYILPLAASVTYTCGEDKNVTEISIEVGKDMELTIETILPSYSAEVLVEDKVDAEVSADGKTLTITAREEGQGKVVILYYNANQTITSVLNVTVTAAITNP